MNSNRYLLLWFVAVTLLSHPRQALAQQTTAFTYQGQLRDGGTNANGTYTMAFKLYDAVSGGGQIGSTFSTSPTLANGLFTVNLDFGAGAFDGSARWLEIVVAGDTLTPRVQVLPAPYAIFAEVAATVTNGAIKNAQLAGNAVNTFNIQSNAVTTTQIADGAVTNRNLTANAVATTNIQNSAVTTSKIADGNVTDVKLAANAVATANIQNSAVTTSKIADDNVTDVKIVSVSGSKVSGAVAAANTAASATTAGTATLANSVAANSIATASLQNSAVTGAKIASGQAVKSLNGLADAVTLSAGQNVTLTANGNDFRISATLTNSTVIGPFTIDSGTVPPAPPYVPSLSGALRFSSSGVTRMALDKDGLGVAIYTGLAVVGGNINTTGSMEASSLDVGTGSLDAGSAFVSGIVTAMSFNTASDRNLKEKFTPVDNHEILERVVSLPISSWNFKTDAKTRHIGPMAQDFFAAFNVGTDDKHIATVDADGVALAAIQGLNEKLKEKDARIEAMEKRLADLEELIKSSTHK